LSTFHRAGRPQNNTKSTFSDALVESENTKKNVAFLNVEYSTKIWVQQIRIEGLERKTKSFPSKNRGQEASFEQIRPLEHFGNIRNVASESEILVKNFQSSIFDVM